MFRVKKRFIFLRSYFILNGLRKKNQFDGVKDEFQKTDGTIDKMSVQLDRFDDEMIVVLHKFDEEMIVA